MAVSARFWRLRATADTYASPARRLVFYDVEFRAVSGGADQLPSSPDAEASSENSAMQRAENAFNGNTGNYWSSELSPAEYQWIAVDAGGTISISHIAIRAAGIGGNSRIPSEMAVETGTSFAGPWVVAGTISPINTGTVAFQENEIIQEGGGNPRLIDGYHTPLIDGGLIQ